MRLGEDVYIGPYCYIKNGAVIGNGTRLEGYVSLGTPPEHRDFFRKTGFGVELGQAVIIREFVTINSGVLRPTVVGDRCILLKGSHVGHDAILEEDVTLSCGVLVGGHSVVMRGANLGLGAVTHQRTVIGSFSMVGMNSTVTKKTLIEPFMKYAGSPAKNIGLNAHNCAVGVYADQLERYQKWLAQSSIA